MTMNKILILAVATAVKTICAWELMTGLGMREFCREKSQPDRGLLCVFSTRRRARKHQGFEREAII